MTRIFVLLLATSLHAQELDAPTRPQMRRGPELATVSRQAAIAKALIAPDPHDLMVLLGMPDQQRHSPDVTVVTATTPTHLDQESERVADAMAIRRLWAATPQPPQPIVPTTGTSCANTVSYACPDSSLSAVRPPANLVQPLPGPVLVANPDSVLVTVSPMSKGASERILGKRLGKIAAVWLVNMENLGSEPVLIAPSAVHRRVAHLEPFDHASMSLLIEDGTRNSFLARAGRAASDVGRGLTFMIAFKAIKIGESWPLALLTGADIGIPYIIGRLKGAETPVSANFERLAWISPIQIGPGESVVGHLFTSAWESASPVSFSIDVSRVQFRKSLQ